MKRIPVKKSLQRIRFPSNQEPEWAHYGQMLPALAAEDLNWQSGSFDWRFPDDSKRRESIEMRPNETAIKGIKDKKLSQPILSNNLSMAHHDRHDVNRALLWSHAILSRFDPLDPTLFTHHFPLSRETWEVSHSCNYFFSEGIRWGRPIKELIIGFSWWL